MDNPVSVYFKLENVLIILLFPPLEYHLLHPKWKILKIFLTYRASLNTNIGSQYLNAKVHSLFRIPWFSPFKYFILPDDSKLFICVLVTCMLICRGPLGPWCRYLFCPRRTVLASVRTSRKSASQTLILIANYLESHWF